MKLHRNRFRSNGFAGFHCRRALINLAIWLAPLLAAPSAEAAWRTQEITLRPGWNAVYLEVEPEPGDMATVFSGVPVRSVWAWTRGASTVQFVQDANTLLPRQPDWSSYFPFAPGRTDVTNLHAIRGGQAYLIDFAGNAPFTWSVRGRAVARPVAWVSNSLNLVGFPIDPARSPTFQDFFASSEPHLPLEAYRLNSSGEWEKIDDPTATNVVAGEAYWVYCKEPSDFAGPVGLALERTGELDFGRTLDEQVVRIRNLGGAARQVRLRTLVSVEPPSGVPALAGEVPLSYWEPSTDSWQPLASPRQWTVMAGDELALRIAVRRTDMTPSARGGLYQSLLAISDGAGTEITLPVVARGMQSTSLASRAGRRQQAQPDARAGLWVGTASIGAVSFAADPRSAARTSPVPAASEFRLRLILHVDAAGVARLLQHVTVMWENGSLKPDPSDPSKQIVDEPGRYVLVAEDSLLPEFGGATVRDGKTVGVRISSAAFGFAAPVPMVGRFDDELVVDNLTVAHDAPLNPFVHRYHPNHDNLDYDFETPLAEGRESFTVSRRLELQFAGEDPDGFMLAGWGDSLVGGTYSETITGLHKEPLYVAGTFRLHQVSRVAVLDDGR